MLRQLILPTAALSMLGCGVAPVGNTSHPLQKVRVRGVEINYVDTGGEKAALVFVHGSLTDYRE